MRVLMVSAFFDEHRGGVERVTGEAARGLAGRGITVEWLASDASATDMSPSIVKKVPVKAWNGLEKRIGVPIPIWGPGAFKAMLAALRRADVLMLQDTLYMGNILSYFSARMLGVPTLIVQHVGPIRFSNPVLRTAMSLADRLVGRRMLAKADLVVFISHAIAADFSGVRFHRNPRIVYNGVNTELFKPASDQNEMVRARKGIRIPEGKPVVLFSGRFVERKGLAIVKGLAILRSDVIFLLAGWGPIDPVDWELANVHVKTANSPEEMREIYIASDALILPSVGEGFPLVIQEALASGLAVICSSETVQADPQLASVVEHAEVDLCDPVGTVEKWDKRLADVLSKSTRETRHDKLERARFAQNRYSWSGAVKIYEALLEEVLYKK